MSFLDQADLDPSEFITQELRRTDAAALVDLDANPDDAVRATQLAQATGLPAPVVYGDLEHYDNQYRAGLTQQLLQNSPELRSYVAANPMASKVSNDDYGALDAVSEKVRAFTDWYSAENTRLASGEKPQGTELLTTPEGRSNLGRAIAKFPEHIVRGLYQSMETAMKPGATTEDMIPFAANVAMLLEGAKLQAPWAKDLRTAAPGDIKLGRPEAERLSSTAEIIQFLKDVDTYGAQTGSKTPPHSVLIPYIQEGKPVPPGVHPTMDTAHANRAKIDAENLDAAVAEAQKSATRERDPDLFANFVAQHNPGDIGVPYDVVRKLYGDKVPAPNDGILGWVPRLQEQLAVAEATGGDISIPTADYLARVEPEVHRELKDFIRARPEGMSVEEAKEAPAYNEGAVGQPLDTVRQAAGLTGPQPKPSLSLSRTGPESDGFHTFDVMDETGQQKATLDLSESTNKKTIRIEMLTAREGVGTIGPKGLSAIAEQIAKEFPLAERIDYHHISGAKGEKPVTEIGKTTIDLAKVREKAALREQAAPPPPAEPSLLQQVQEAILGKSPEAQAAEALAMEERALFDKASAIGMTVAQYRLFATRMQQRALEDVAYAEKKALAEQKKRLTAEWKANRVDVRAEVREEINNRPEVELDEMLREGGFRLSREGLTDEQAAAIPANYIAKDGILPDDLSSMFGGRTGGELIEKLIALIDAREAAEMKPQAYLERIVDVATDHAMEARYGALERNIIEEAKDQVLSETQESLLHEEVLARAEEAGLQLTLGKDELKAAIKGFFDRLPMKEVSSDKSLAEAGRAGRAAEMALLKGDYAEAFRQKQRQFNAFTMANYAKRFEKEQARFDKTAAKYKKADVPRVESATKNYIQGLLSEAGYPIKLTPEEIAASINFEGHGTLSNYVAYLDDFGIENAVPESILEGGVKPLADMSTAEFLDFKDAIDVLDHIGREQRKINVAGEKQDFADWKAKAIANLKERPIRSAEEAEKGGKWLYRIDAPWTRAEEMFKDFDMRKELGPFFEAIVMPYELSKAKSYEMLETLSKDLRAIPGFKAKWQKTLEEKIPNDFIYDVWNDTMFDLNRWNMVKMMLNWGNESNAMKLSEGILRAGREVGDKISKEEIALVHEKIGDLFTKHARKEDWEFVQKIWDVFEGWKGEVDTLHRNVAGKAPKWIQGREVITPHGTFKGGYFPLIPDKLRRVGAGVKEKGQPDTGPLGQDYFRATTNQKHLKTRTGATYFVDITNGPEQLVGRMQQVIHDLAYRDFVVNAGKVLYDTEIKNAIQKHYGIEYEQQLVPWLKRVANQSNAPERELQGWNDVLKRFRGNLVASALPLNYAVMFSPSVGLLNVKKLVEFNANRAVNKKLVMENSKEVPHMIYTMDRDLTEAMKAVTAKKTWSSYQLEITEKMFKPLLWMEQQFRMATFYGEFMKQKAKGRTDFQASAIADSIVRQNHSVGAVGDLPALMASKNEFVRLSTLFMGYFTAQRNWMRQMPHYARQREWGEFGKVLWGSVIIAGLFNALLFTDRKKDEGMLSYLGRSAASVPLAGVPILRNVWNYYSQGYRSTDPITSWALAVGKLGKDGWDWLHNKPVKRPIKDTMTVLGGGIGLPGAVQIGRSGQGIYDGLTERQRPKNIVEWGRLVLKGEAQLKKGN